MVDNKLDRDLSSPFKGERECHHTVAIVGGGAAGFFCAIRLKELRRQTEVTIFEKSRKVLAKVAISGGGRCNCTNTFAQITDLSQAYPRGATLLKRLFKQFSPKDTFQWFEEHGVPLVIQEDQCIFPKVQDSRAVIDCFMNEVRKYGIRIETGCRIEDPVELLKGFTDVVVTVGGVQHTSLHLPTPLVECVPSLFTFNIDDTRLHQLMGIVVENAVTSIPGTKLKAEGPLLITHWGMSGPAILKLSSYAARHLAEKDYKSPLAVNWTGETNADRVREHIINIIESNAKTRLIDNVRPFGLNTRLWDYLLQKIGLGGKPLGDIGKKNVNRLVEVLTNDQYTISSRCQYKDEFVTCGGVPLDSIDKRTMESLHTPHLYFAGEVLDIDGITGGFNFQAAWTTADAAARGITRQVSA